MNLKYYINEAEIISSRRNVPVTREDRIRWCKQLRKHNSVREIAALMLVSESTIRRWLHA